MTRLRHRGAGTLLSLFLVPALAAQASAQVVVGASAKPEVVVDTSVLERLGSAPTLPDLFLGGGQGDASRATPEPPASPSADVPQLRHPLSPIILKKPVHKPAKPKTAVAAAHRPAKAPAVKTPAVKTAVVPPAPAATAAPTPIAPAPEAQTATPLVKQDTPATEPAPGAPAQQAQQSGLPAVSLPAIVPRESKPAAPSETTSRTAAPPSKPETASEAKPVEATGTAKTTEQAPQTTPRQASAPVEETPAAVEASAPIPVVPPPAATAPAASAVSSTPAASAASSTPPASGASSTPPASGASSTPPAPAAASSPAATAGAPMPPPLPRDPQEARLPSPTAPAAGGAVSTEAPLTILFERDSARLPDEVRTSLGQLAERLAADGGLQLQLLAYAEGDEDNTSKARRLSLSRALAVRSYLIDQGVRSTRIEVRALGNKVPDGPADRVDILVQKR